MYALLLVAFSIFLTGFYQKAKFIAGEGGDEGPLGVVARGTPLAAFFQDPFFYGKSGEESKSWPFSRPYLLWFYHPLDCHRPRGHPCRYTPFKIYKGPTYIIISFLSDIAGVAILVGIALGLQETLQRETILSATEPGRELTMYAILVALVVVGYALEGLRIWGTGMPVGESLWSPVGWALARIIGVVPWGDETMGQTYRVLWMLHMVNTMVFVALIPLHEIFPYCFYSPLLPLSQREGAVLSPMDFEDESAESFGLGHIGEMTVKNRFDLVSCVECGRCSLVCPALVAGKPLDPKTIITKARDLSVSNAKANLWENKTYSSHEIDACTTCGACMEECPLQY